MAKSAAQRALEILAEIDEQEKLTVDTISSKDLNTSNTPAISSKVKIKNQLSQEELDSENIVNDISKLDKNDLVKGIIMSEILSKPVALRRNRRI